MQQSQGPARKAPSNSRGMCRNPAQAPWNLTQIESNRIAQNCYVSPPMPHWFCSSCLVWIAICCTRTQRYPRTQHCTHTTQQALSFSWVCTYRLRMTEVWSRLYEVQLQHAPATPTVVLPIIIHHWFGTVSNDSRCVRHPTLATVLY